MVAFRKRTIVVGVLWVLMFMFGSFARAQDVMHAEELNGQAHPVFDERDVVAIIGNTFAVRMQRFPYFETLVSTQLPQHNLRFRYLGRAGDEVAFRPRPLNFGDLHTHLRDVGADVIFACFGMNEAFNGLDHLGAFRSNLDGFVDTLRTTAYNGEHAPSVVLVSPIAHEDHARISADAVAHNQSLDAYSEAMADYADQHDHVRYIDLYHPTKQMMESSPEEHLTINEIHLSKYGYWAASQVMGKALNLTAPQPRLVLDAKREKAVGDEPPISNVVPGGPGMAFRVSEVTRFLPPAPEKEAPSSISTSIAPVVEIRNLSSGQHVLELEGKAIAEGDSAAWAEGITVDVHRNALRQIHEAVARKSQIWFYRYRAVNGEYIYGRRKEPFGVNNFPGEFRRLEMMVEATEHQIWRQIKKLLYLSWRIRPSS